MSRAYRIRVQETLRRVVRASDHVSTQLELLDILPAEQMAELLSAELEQRGFRKQGKSLTRHDAGVAIEIEVETGTVTVRAQSEERVDLEASTEVIADAQEGRSLKGETRKAAREQVRKGLEKKAEEREGQLQQQVTEKLEGRLGELRRELDQVVNRVTAEALKRKAAQMGQIKELTEDPQSGALTIVLEV